MRKIAYISLIYLGSLTLSISCSKKNLSQDVPPVNEYLQRVKNTGLACLENLIAALGYQHERYTELVMQCNILTLQRLDAKVRKLKGQARIDIVILGVQCDNIARLLSRYENECKNSLTVTGL